MDTKEAVQGCSPWKYKKHFGCANNIEDSCYICDFFKEWCSKKYVTKELFWVELHLYIT